MEELVDEAAREEQRRAKKRAKSAREREWRNAREATQRAEIEELRSRLRASEHVQRGGHAPSVLLPFEH